MSSWSSRAHRWRSPSAARKPLALALGRDRLRRRDGRGSAGRERIAAAARPRGEKLGPCLETVDRDKHPVAVAEYQRNDDAALSRRHPDPEDRALRSAPGSIHPPVAAPAACSIASAATVSASGRRSPISSGGELARAGGELSWWVPLQLDHERARRHQRARALGDEREDDLRDPSHRRRARAICVVASSAATVCGRDRRAVRRGSRVAAGVIDRRAPAKSGEHDDGLLVVRRLNCAPSAFSAEIEVPERLAFHEDRHAEEASHRRVRRGEAVGVGVCSKSRRRSGAGASISTPRTPRPRGGLPIAARVGSSTPLVRESRASSVFVLVEDTERRVARVGQILGGPQHSAPAPRRGRAPRARCGRPRRFPVLLGPCATDPTNMLLSRPHAFRRPRAVLRQLNQLRRLAKSSVRLGLRSSPRVRGFPRLAALHAQASFKP